MARRVCRNDDPDPFPEVLRDALGEVSSEERLLWGSLSEKKRSIALERIAAFADWLDPAIAISAEEAAERANLSLSRFYRMARDWEDADARSLVGLGLGVKRPRKTTGSKAAGQKIAFEAALRLVEADPQDQRSVTDLVGELASALAHELPSVPGIASLRSTVVEARRRRDSTDTVGVDVAFDLSACAMLDEGGELYVLAALIDRGTGIILGAALPDGTSARACFPPVAADALGRIDAAMGSMLPWAPHSQSCEIVSFDDEDAAWVHHISAAVPGVNVQPAVQPRRFGRYIRRHVGEGVGNLRLLPTLTWSGTPAETSAPKRRYGPEQAAARLAIEVDAHNALVADRLGGSERSVPQGLLRLLRSVVGA